MTRTRRFAFVGSIIATILFGRVAVSSEPMQHWDAFSTSAEGITGDIELSSSRIVFENGTVLKLMDVGSAPGIVAVGLYVANAKIYRVMNPQNPLLLHGNRLCSEPVTYVAWVKLPIEPFDGLRLDPIMGRQLPRSNMSRDRLCGGFTFTRDRKGFTRK